MTKDNKATKSKELAKAKQPGEATSPESKSRIRRAERFYGTVFVLSVLVSGLAFAGLLTVSAFRTTANDTQADLIATQAAMQQVSLRLNTLDPNDPINMAALGRQTELLTSKVEDLSEAIASVTDPHPALVASNNRIDYWYAAIVEDGSDLTLSRARQAFQNASEVLTDELLIIERELRSQGDALLIALNIGYAAMGVAVLFAIYFLGIMFMSIRSILVWDDAMIRSFDSKGKTQPLPGIKVPLSKLFPGSTLLTEQSHTIAKNFQAQVDKQRTLANKNDQLADRLKKTVNELVDSREEFARSSQLAAVGKVAGSVSHEINNPVTGVLGYLAFIKKRSTDDSLVVWIDKAIKEVERIGRIARSLLVFSRHSATQAPAAFDIGPVVDNVVTLMGPQMRESEVEVIVDPITNLPSAIGRVDELQQCLLNVLLNARYALNDQPQKKIWIDMKKTGDTLEIAVRDSGTGVPEKVQEHLFQPFYTTKPAGQGSGLGLAVAKELMTGMGGSIAYDKSYGPGARFVLSVPIYDAAKAARLAEATKAATETTSKAAAKEETKRKS